MEKAGGVSIIISYKKSKFTEWGRNMGAKIILEVEAKGPNSDFPKLVVDASNKRPVDFSDFNVSIIQDEAGYFKEYFISDVYKYGLTSVLLRQPLNEAILQSNMPARDVASVMITFLEGIIQDNDELIIIDPFLFAPTTDTNYRGLIVAILSHFAQKLGMIRTIVHPNKIDITLRGAVESNLKALNSSLLFTHQTSLDYHDRFWIAGRSRGILTGSSLNGLGKKYALIDRLKDKDVTDILNSLVSAALI